ncbi:MAG: hypothetical protein HQ509_10480 [Candidatus Marinimicrobia bacterium]|nr:hypothetical protein [Candidatus Neomarinimicrobiota bacterium]
MNIDRRQMIMIGVLIVVFLYLLYDYGIIFSSETTEIAQEIQELTEGQDVVDDISVYAAMMVLPEVNWPDGWNGDPFFYTKMEIIVEEGGLLGNIFGVTKEGTAIGFDLNGISWLGNSGYALINESILSEGDVIGGYSVEKVAVNYVVLKQGLKTIRLTLDE